MSDLYLDIANGTACCCIERSVDYRTQLQLSRIADIATGPPLDRTLLNEVRRNGPLGGACDMGVDASHATDYDLDLLANIKAFDRSHFASVIPKARDVYGARQSTFSENCCR